MNTVTPAVPENFVAELVRRGLPVEYAQHTAAEFVDHHRDLVDELRRSGMDESAATAEAMRRLGDPRILVRKTVREYQRRHWCGRWRLVTFVFGPIGVFVAMGYTTGLLAIGVRWWFGRGVGFTVIESRTAYAIAYSAKIWLTFGLPLLIVAAFCRLGTRAAMSRSWAYASSGTLALFAAFLNCSILTEPTHPSVRIFFIGYYPWFLPQFWDGRMLRFFANNPSQVTQLVLPMVATSLLLMYFSQRTRCDLRSLVGGC